MVNNFANNMIKSPITPTVTAAVSGFTLGYDKTSEITWKNVFGAAGTVVAGALIAKQNLKNKQTSHFLHVSLANFAVFLGAYSLGKICQPPLKHTMAHATTLLNGILQGACGWYAANATTTTGRLCALGGWLGTVLEEKMLRQYTSWYEENEDDNNYGDDDNDNSSIVKTSPILCFLGGLLLRTAAPQTMPNPMGV